MPRGVPNVKAEKPVETPAVETPAVETPEEPTVAVEPDEAPEAEKPVEAKHAKSKDRFETFEATRPDGTIVVVKRNIDTGEQTVSDK